MQLFSIIQNCGSLGMFSKLVLNCERVHEMRVFKNGSYVKILFSAKSMFYCLSKFQNIN